MGQKRKADSASHDFKITMVALLFFLIGTNLIDIVYFAGLDVMPDKLLLAVALFIVLYMWVCETKDYQLLLKLNKDLRESHEQLKEAEIDTIAALIKAEEEKDEYTRGHSERVTAIALAIADEMGLSPERKLVLERSAILHDIGKIGISDAILHNRGELNEDSWEIIKSHPRKSDEILKPLKFLTAERKVILNHHERYDGKGYPQGLRGDEIPLESQILSVADAFDAMNSSRSYRAALSKEDIIEQIGNIRGAQLSGRVVDSFLELLKKRPALWQKEGLYPTRKSV